MSLPAAPPSYAEATAGDKELGIASPPYGGPPPSMMPPPPAMHPSWAYVHSGPSMSPGYCAPGLTAVTS